MKLTSLVLVTLILASLVISVHSLDVSSSNFCICAGHESLAGWSVTDASVNATLDNIDFQEGNASLSVSLQNETRASGIAFDIGTGTTVSNDTILILWVKILNVSLIRSLYLQIGDSNRNWRQYNDTATRFALETSNWTRVAIQLSSYVYQVNQFNASSVRYFWFGTFDGGAAYSQTFWIDDIILQSASAGSTETSSFDVLSTVSAAFWVIAVYALVLPFGIAISDFLKLPSAMGQKRKLSLLPLQISLGMATVIILDLVSSLVRIDPFVVVGLWISATTIVVVTRLRSFLKTKRKGESLIDLHTLRINWDWGVVVGLSFTTYLFSQVASTLGWAPPNDSIRHAMYVSLILSNLRTTTSYLPISPVPLNFWSYPRGFYGLPSSLSFVSGIYPGQSILIVGAAIVALIPPLFYTTTLMRTRSIIAAIFSFILTFLLPGAAVYDAWSPSHDLLLGAFLVATYPSMIGNLILLTMFAIIVVFDDFGPIRVRSTYWLPIFLLLTVVLAFTYYSYVVFPIAFLVLRVLFSQGRAYAKKNGKLPFIMIVLALVIVFLGIAIETRSYAITHFSLRPDLQYQISQKLNPLAPGSQYLIYAFLVVATVSLALSTRLLSEPPNYKNYAAEVFFGMMLFFHILDLSSESLHSSLFWMTNSNRSLMVLYGLTYILIPIYLWRFFSHPPVRVQTLLPWRRSFPSARFLGKIGGLFLLFLAFSPMIFAIYNYTPSPLRPDILQVPRTDDNYLACQWLAENVQTNQLVLNDLSLSGLSVTSFRAVPVVNDMNRLENWYIYHTLPSDYAVLMLSADRILQHPGEYYTVRDLMIEWHISYIYISDSSRTIGLTGSDGRFAPPITWTMTQDELLAVYMNNPYLKTVYRAGNAAVFEVVT